METDFEIATVLIDPRPLEIPPMARSVVGNFRITPRFIPDGWRVLRPREEVEEGDYRWKKVARVVNGSHYVPATKIGDLVGYPITYIRRSQT